jgi:uncharacterized protein (TIGR02145 family)
MSGFSVLPDPNKFRLEPGEPVVAPPTLGYGLLYNWYAATDVREIAASGWHVPMYDEFQTLSTALGGNSVSGGKLKEVGLTHWSSPNTGATNEAGFNGRGAGQRSGVDGSFQYLGIYSFIATATDLGASWRIRGLYNTSAVLGTFANGYRNGHTVRLVKDSTTLSHGQTSQYMGNDGHVYSTICIGTQEWLADNLAETKFRTGESIPEVTDNAAWAALTSAGMCAYNNDWNNV